MNDLLGIIAIIALVIVLIMFFIEAERLLKNNRKLFISGGFYTAKRVAELKKEYSKENERLQRELEHVSSLNERRRQSLLRLGDAALLVRNEMAMGMPGKSHENDVLYGQLNLSKWVKRIDEAFAALYAMDDVLNPKQEG